MKNPDLININEQLRFSVSAFNDFMNKNFDLIGTLIVEGEITQFNKTPKGGVNIVLKDDKQPAVLNLSGYAPWIEGIDFIKVGMKVATWGKPNIWSQAGRFALNIYKIIPIGEGALQEAYNQLKLKLEQEGLFNEDRKRPLPDYVSKIALLTGKDSAAQSDFLKILKENKAGFEIDFYPVQVQGKYSESEIINTLKNLDYKKYDCIALVRGGGSLEDLITFNSEKLARIIYSLPIPIIVGVGHEKDESIADFVADIRASTPSQAAYYLISNNNNFINKLDMMTDNIKSIITNHIDRINKQIKNFESILNNRFTFKLNSYKNIILKAQNLYSIMRSKLDMYKQQTEFLDKLLNSYNPSSVLKRGYTLITNKSGTVLSSTTQLSVDEEIQIKLKDGQALTKILNISNER